MSRTASPSVGRAYGLAMVCRVWGLARSTVYHWRKGGDGEDGKRRRRGPEGPCRDEELVERIKAILENSPFHGEGHRKVWARLRFEGLRTAKGRVLRLMRENDLLAPQRMGRPRGPASHDGTIITQEPDEMWGTDMTTTVTTGEGLAHIFVAVDHCTAECVGIHASKSGDRFEALEPIRQGVADRFDAVERNAADRLALRHDHGSAYMSDDFQEEIKFLGIAPSPAFVRAPEGNGCAERFIRTLKENLLWVHYFHTIEELHQALHDVKELYNETWIIERHGYLTPAQKRRACLDEKRAA